MLAVTYHALPGHHEVSVGTRFACIPEALLETQGIEAFPAACCAITVLFAKRIRAEIPDMKTKNGKKNAGHPTVGPATEQAEAARQAREAIKKDPNSPENYTALAGGLRMLSQFLRERNPEASDNLLFLASAAAWEAKRRSTPVLISGRTKQEVKVLIAWLRTKNHLSPDAAEAVMEQFRSEFLERALNSSDAGYLLGFVRS